MMTSEQLEKKLQQHYDLIMQGVASQLDQHLTAIASLVGERQPAPDQSRNESKVTEFQPQVGNGETQEGETQEDDAPTTSITNKSLTQLRRRTAGPDVAKLPQALQPRFGSPVGKLVLSKPFETVAGFVIILNAVFNVITANSDMENPGEDPPDTFLHIEIFFLVFYTVELVCRLLAYRALFFIGDDWRWNVLDFVLVLIAMLDLTATVVLKGEDVGVNVTFLRSLRALRLTKILRVGRIMRHFKELRLMLDSLVGSMVHLFWSFIMLLFVFFMFSIAFVQTSSGYLADNVDTLDDDTIQSTKEWFATVQRGMLTLFMVSTNGDDWINVYNVVVKTGIISSALWIFFVGFFQIALLNILTGLFVEQAMKLAQPDYASRELEQRKKEESEFLELNRLCEDMDVDGSGAISCAEFQRCLESGKLKSSLMLLDLDIRDAEQFFQMLADSESDRQVPIETFIAGCLRLKGGASSIDLQRLEYKILGMQRKQDSLCDYIHKRLDGTWTTPLMQGLSSMREIPV